MSGLTRPFAVRYSPGHGLRSQVGPARVMAHWRASQREGMDHRLRADRALAGELSGGFTMGLRRGDGGGWENEAHRRCSC